MTKETRVTVKFFWLCAAQAAAPTNKRHSVLHLPGINTRGATRPSDKRPARATKRIKSTSRESTDNRYHYGVRRSAYRGVSGCRARAESRQSRGGPESAWRRFRFPAPALVRYAAGARHGRGGSSAEAEAAVTAPQVRQRHRRALRQGKQQQSRATHRLIIARSLCLGSHSQERVAHCALGRRGTTAPVDARALLRAISRVSRTQTNF